jgi:glycerol-3-phosphate acyltransferase PlsY
MLFISYVIGSIPSAVWIGKTFHGIDVREHGSGNAGATNTFRVLGKKAGTIVLCIDIVKGFLAVLPAHLIVEDISINFINYQLLLGTAAVLGHVFPLFAKFKGGKGVATLLGLMFGIHPLGSLLCLIIFLVILITSKYVS